VSAAPPWRRLAWVARREFLERLRSKAFVIATILGPLLMGAFILGPGLLMTRQRGKPLRVAVLDDTGRVRAAVEESLRRRTVAGVRRFELSPAPGAGGVDGAREAVRGGLLDGFVYLPADALERCRAEYHGRYVSNALDIQVVDAAVEEALLARRLETRGLGADDVREVTRKLDLKTVRLTERGAREDSGGSVMLSLVLMMLLYSAVAMWGQAIMNGVIEEKANRVVEVLVSSIPSWVLFAGKLLGVGAAGLAQFGLWTLSLLLLGLYAQAGPMVLPEIPPGLLAAMVGFFLLGYFLYGALYAAVGAAVNTQQEAQALAFPVLSPLILAVAFFPGVMSRPDGALAVTLTLIPFFAPILMFLRVTLLPPPAWQLALSVALTVLTIGLVVWGAARIYRVGILMYGKRPTLPEMLKWLNR
jgi:ABC-2 type transport system permease protein